jgi:hypothetical protein
LPAGFFWDTLDLNDDTVCEEVKGFLEKHYVESPDGMF